MKRGRGCHRFLFFFLNKNLFGSWLGGLSTFHVEIFSIKLGLSQIPESYANESSFGGRKLIDEEGIEKLLEKPVEDTEFESDIIYEQIISDIESSSDWAYKKHWLRIMTKRKKNICSN